MIDLIIKKRNGENLQKEDFELFIQGYLDGSIPDYQVSALLMAIYFQGMTQKETVAFTQTIIGTGEVLDLSEISEFKVDKHSTGGVGDKTTLIVAPLVASAGVCVTKMSGRGIGHTGGTIDKLSAIPHLSTNISKADFTNNMKAIGIGYTEQTKSLVPADKKLYALRDVTGTVRSLPLIAASIMSKKIASGSDGIVLDVKCGDGAFMDNLDEAKKLAHEMVSLGIGMNKKMTAVISNMNQPLGYAIGNSIEVIEAVEVLKGNGPVDITELSLELSSHMLILAGNTKTIQEAKDLLRENITSGKALNKFREMISSLGGDINVIDDYTLFKQPQYVKQVYAEADGYIHKINALQLGKTAMNLGGGRKTKEDKIDVSAGIKMSKKEGDKVAKGELLATLYTDKMDIIDESILEIQRAHSISRNPVEPEDLILLTITANEVFNKV